MWDACEVKLQFDPSTMRYYESNMLSLRANPLEDAQKRTIAILIYLLKAKNHARLTQQEYHNFKNWVRYYGIG